MTFRNRLEEVCDRVIKITNKSSVIVDGGCGGKGTLANLSTDRNIIGFDLNKKNVSYVGDITCISIKSEVVDLFISCEVLEHLDIAELDIAFDEIHRVLKKGGYMIFTFPIEWKPCGGAHKTHIKPHHIHTRFEDYEVIEETVVYKNKKAKESGLLGNHLIMMRK